MGSTERGIWSMENEKTEQHMRAIPSCRFSITVKNEMDSYLSRFWKYATANDRNKTVLMHI